MRRSVTCVGLVLLGGLGHVAWAAGGTATDGAVSLTYTPSHWSGSAAASLSGTEPAAADPLYAVGWWYRAEGDTREYPMPAPDSETYDGGVIHVHWANLDGKGFELTETTYVADYEGPSGGFWSKLGIKNNNATTRSFAIFHLLDMDLGGTYANDNALPLADVYSSQWKYMKFGDPVDAAAVGRYAGKGFADHQVGDGSMLRAMLNDANVDDLDNSGLPFANGDVAAALERRYLIPPLTSMGVSVSASSRLPNDHVKGAYLNLPSTPGLWYRTPALPALMRGMRRTTQIDLNISNYVAPGLEMMSVDDFDGDFFDELATRDPVTGETRIDNSTIVGAPSPAPNWVFSSSGDFDGDGKADIFWRNVTSQKLTVWLMNGNAKIGSVVPSPDHAVDGNWAVAGTADWNGDGARDILWYNQTSGRVVLWYMNAAVQRITGAFTTPAAVGDNNWRVVAVGDFGRGAGGVLNTQDIVWQNDTSLRVVVWHMDLAGTRTSGTFTTPDTLGSAAVVIGPR